VPHDLSAIVGDAIHNLRVSLDHLAWQLVVSTGKTPVAGPGGTSFPIYKTARLTHPQINPGVSMEVRDLLDEVQPYQRMYPANHELAVLHGLDISDKHHKLLVTVVGALGAGWWGEAELIEFNRGPYADGDEVCRFTYSDSRSKREFRPGIMFTVCLNDPAAGAWKESLNVAMLVRRSLRYVESEVLPRFERFFPPSAS
jgi:hypothetical protein